MSIALRRSGCEAAKVIIRWTSSATSQPKIPEVKGLTSNCVQVPNEPVGPGAAKSTDYKNPEYFCYNDTSYFEAEVEMAKYRLPQPSNKK